VYRYTALANIFTSHSGVYNYKGIQIHVLFEKQCELYFCLSFHFLYLICVMNINKQINYFLNIVKFQKSSDLAGWVGYSFGLVAVLEGVVWQVIFNLWLMINHW